MKKLLIIKTGSTFPFIRDQYGDFEGHILQQIAVPMSDVIIAPVYLTKALPKLDDVSAIIITGSHAMVTAQDSWSVLLAGWLRNVRTTRLPVLGICYGHQLLAAAFGGTVGYHPGGEEIGTVKIELTAAGKQDALLGVLPDWFSAHVAHAQSVLKLPADAKLLAKNDFEPHHAYVIDDHIWGVQFHPEFNAGIIRSYIKTERDALTQAGKNVDALLAAVCDHACGKRLLCQFIKLAG